MELNAIGYVESELRDRGSAPKQGYEGAPDAWLVFDETVLPGLTDVQVGEQYIVLTWFNHAHRHVLRVVPRDDPTNPETGVFSTRSPDRPNPVGLHMVKILAVEGQRLLVSNMEAVDGTPVIDLKPVLVRVTDY